MTGDEADLAADILRIRYPGADVQVTGKPGGAAVSIKQPGDSIFLVLGDGSPWLALFGVL